MILPGGAINIIENCCVCMFRMKIQSNVNLVPLVAKNHLCTCVFCVFILK